MIIQLNLFGDEPVEAHIEAPINDVVSVPKKYKLVPPRNILIETENQQIAKNVEKENVAVQKKVKIQKVKKEKIVSGIVIDNLEINTESIKKKEPKINNIVALDLFAEILPEQIKTHITEAFSESILEVIPDTTSKVIQHEISKSISEVIPVAVTEKITNTFIIQESIPISAQSSNEAKTKYVLRVPNVVKIEETEPIKKIEKVTILEVRPTNIEKDANIELPKPIEKTDLDIFPSMMVDEDQLTVKSSKGRLVASQFHADLLLINIPDDDILFTKQYYPISEVATMFNVKVSLLRFWENEFDILKPRKNRKGDRLFRPEDVKSLKLIYFLLREKKYTIEGAKMFIKKGKKVKEKFAAIESLKKIKGMLMELKAGLSF